MLVRKKEKEKCHSVWNVTRVVVESSTPPFSLCSSQCVVPETFCLKENALNSHLSTGR